MGRGTEIIVRCCRRGCNRKSNVRGTQTELSQRISVQALPDLVEKTAGHNAIPRGWNKTQ